MEELQTIPLGQWDFSLPKQDFKLPTTPNQTQVVKDSSGNWWEILPDLAFAGANVVSAVKGTTTPENVYYVTETEENDNTLLIVVFAVITLIALYFLLR
jgi:hypothetical protein